MNRGGLFFTFFLSSAFFSLAQGCSSSSSSSAGGACANYVAALRDSSKECGRFNVSPSREAEYLARFQRTCEAALSAPGSGIAPSVLDQCAAKIREQCGDDDACEDVIDDVRGSLGEGATCSDDTQCVSGQCRREATSQSSDPCGKCAPAKQVGEPCPEGGCVAGARCVGTSSGMTSQQVCRVVKTVNEGEACGFSDGNETVRCASGLYCKFDSASSSGTTGTCTQPLGEGAACGTADSQSARCKPPLSCVNQRCGRLSASGQPCEASNDCANGLGCGEDGTCTAIVWGPLGATCDDNLRRCDRGFCAQTGASGSTPTGTCVDYIADGQPCDPAKSLEQRCDSQSACRNGTCQFEDPTQCK